MPAASGHIGWRRTRPLLLLLLGLFAAGSAGYSLLATPGSSARRGPLAAAEQQLRQSQHRRLAEAAAQPQAQALLQQAALKRSEAPPAQESGGYGYGAPPGYYGAYYAGPYEGEQARSAGGPAPLPGGALTGRRLLADGSDGLAPELVYRARARVAAVVAAGLETGGTGAIELPDAPPGAPAQQQQQLQRLARRLLEAAWGAADEGPGAALLPPPAVHGASLLLDAAPPARSGYGGYGGGYGDPAGYY